MLLSIIFLLVTYLGCFIDSTNRILANGTTFTNNSPQLCAQYCSSSGYSFAGVEAANQCFCGNTTIGNMASLKTSEADCSMSCTGDQSQKCGGSWRINIWQLTQPMSLSSTPMIASSTFPTLVSVSYTTASTMHTTVSTLAPSKE